MTDLHARVRDRLRAQILAGGGSRAFDDPTVFAEVEALLRTAAATTDATKLILPELLGNPDSWRLTTSMRYQSHRTKGPASLFMFLKRSVLMPMLRWLFEYSRDNFERQRHTNQVLFACVQELAIETSQLRRELRRLAVASPELRAPSPESRTPTPEPREV